MKALPTQFDNKRLSSAVATPTCSSCCCCCCCLATSIASSSLLAQRIGKEGEKHQVHNRHLLTVLAALFVPITGLVVQLGLWIMNVLLASCTTERYSTAYSVCTSPRTFSILPVLVIAPFVVLWFLYTSVKIENPVKRAMLVTILIAVAFTAEFFGGMVLILTGVGGVIYLLLVPVLVGWISVWYHRHLGKEATVASGPITPTPPVLPTEQLTENPQEYADPTQPDPPTPSTE